MKIYFDLLFFAFIWVFVLDVSGFWCEFSSFVKKWLTKGAFSSPFTLKPFSCSLCMTFWTGFVYLIAVGGFSVPRLAFVCLCAYITPILKDAMILIRDAFADMLGKDTFNFK